MIILGNINTSSSSNGLAKFPQIINKLDQMAPRKKKHMRGNNMPFFSKELSSAHTKKSATKNLLSQENILSK